MCFRLTSTEAYFVSEALYCPPDELDNSRQVTLQVATLGKHLASPDKVNTSISFTLLFIEIVFLKLIMKQTAPEHGIWLYMYRGIYREQTPQPEPSAFRIRGRLTPAHSTDIAVLQNFDV